MLRQQPGRPEATQVGHDHAGPLLRQCRRNVVVGVHVEGEAVRQDDWPAVWVAKLQICHLEQAGPNSFHTALRCGPV